MKFKDLINNEELNHLITEDWEDFEENAPVIYEVWAIGYDHDDAVTDVEFILKEFDDPEEAVTFAKSRTWSDIILSAPKELFDKYLKTLKYIALEVETTVVDEDDCSMNIGSIYEKRFILE